MLDDLRRVSERLGGDPNLVQGAGGNTSLKDPARDVIWVKASGALLANACDRDIFAALSLAACKRKIAKRDFAGLNECAHPDLAVAGDLRPSIETALHVLMPHPCVGHVHALNTLAASIQPKLAERVSGALDGLTWARLPYVTPGRPLAETVEGLLKTRPVDVLMLDNHGLVVGADTPASMAVLIDEVEARLAPLMRAAPSPDDDPLPIGNDAAANLSPVEALKVRALAFDALARAAAAAGTLYPDHVVFLGPGVAVCEAGESPRDALDRASSERGATVRLVIAPGVGVFFDGELTRVVEEMIVCVAKLARRIASVENLKTLDAAEERALINWEAEQYRRALSS